MSAIVSTIQFSHPRPRRKCIDPKPAGTTPTGSPFRILKDCRSTSLQFRHKIVQSKSKQRERQQEIAQLKLKFEEEMRELRKKEEELDSQIQFLKLHNQALNTRNLMSLDHILYLEDRCNFEEDWYKRKLSERADNISR